MANIASQKKRILRSERERTENRLLTSTVKTYFRRLESAIESGDSDAIAKEQRELTSKIDKAVQKGAMHKTPARARRRKPRASRTRSPPPRRLQTGASRCRCSVTCVRTLPRYSLPCCVSLAYSAAVIVRRARVNASSSP